MQMLTRLLPTTATAIDANRIEAIAGTSDKARDGNIVDMSRMDTTTFLRSGTILWSHDPKEPVGIPYACAIDVNGRLRIGVEFAPLGASDTADKIHRLVQAGIIRNMSIGFMPIEMAPLDPRLPKGGQRITRSELCEVSFVSVPSDRGAIITTVGSAPKANLSDAAPRERERQKQDYDRRKRILAAMELAPETILAKKLLEEQRALDLRRKLNPDLDWRMRRFEAAQLAAEN
ncbi:UNVERIFIED_ORG: HK97 family phage prohead protease [Sphingomonas sp. R1F5B]